MIIEIADEVNCVLSGFPHSAFNAVQDSIKFMEKGARQTAAYKADLWDGKVSMLDDEGVTYNYYLDTIIDVLENHPAIDPDDIEIVDSRKPLIKLPDDIADIPIDYLAEETGYPKLRDRQHTAMMAMLSTRRGLFELATNFGKTILCLGVSKRLDPYVKTLIITPSEQLALQTAEDYAKADISSCFIKSSMSKKKRQESIDKNRHIIMTSKMFCNCVSMFDSSEYAVIIDEAHIFGEVFQDALRFDFSDAQFCWGITGTLPHDDKLKINRIKATVGGDVVQYVSTKQITEDGNAAKANVRLVEFHHKKVEEYFDSLMDEDMFDWSTEASYYSNNEERLEAIAKYIESLDPKNTLILSHAGFGTKLAERMGHEYVHKDTKLKDRKRLFSSFSDGDDVTVQASFGTSATGISENRIFRLILIELGADRKLLIQSVGRGIRLDGDVNEIEVVDIGSNTKFAKKHRKERIKIYKKEGHTLKLPPQEIEVEEIT